MKVGITPRFEQSPYGEFWYSFEKSILSGVIEAFDFSSLSLLSPEIHVDFDSLDLLIFSGGATPGTNKSRDDFEAMLFLEGIRRKLPMIGICRGAQLFAVLTGSSLKKISGHTNIVRQTNGERNFGPCFHEWAIDSLSKEWKILSKDLRDDSIELFCHEKLPILGVLAHPERCPESSELFVELLRIIRL